MRFFRKKQKKVEIADGPFQHVARRFLNSQIWCDHIVSLDLELEIVGVLCVYKARFVEPVPKDTDGSAWVVLGDLPPGIVLDDPDADVKQVLRFYISRLREYADAVDRGETDLSSYMPILYRHGSSEIPPSPELAYQVRMKSNALEEVILPEI